MQATGVPLARSQEAIWEFVSCFDPEDPGRAGFNVFDTMPLRGPVDVDAFRAAVSDVAARHDALRLVFADLDPDPTVLVRDDVADPLTVMDLSAEPAHRRGARLAALLGADTQRAFDLRNGPLWSVRLVVLSETEAVVAVSLCHLIADGWSTGVVLRDLETAYRARTTGGPPPAAPALGYAEAMAPPQLTGADRRRRDDFWRAQLLPLPDRWPFPAAPRAADVDVTARFTLSATLPAELARRFHSFARQRGMTPFLLSMGAHRILLGALTGWDRLVVGTATSGRDAPGTAGLVGQFTNNVYVATTITAGTTLADALDRVRSATFAAMRHTASFKEIARAVNPDFDRSRPWPFLHLYHSWFQSAAPPKDATAPHPATVGITEQASRGRRPPAAALTAQRIPMWAKRGEPGLTVSHDRRGVQMTFNPGFWDRDAAAAAVSGYGTVLEALLRDPHQRIGDLKGL